MEDSSPDTDRKIQDPSPYVGRKREKAEDGLVVIDKERKSQIKRFSLE